MAAKTDADFKISQAKTRLIIDQPFFATIACSLPIREVPQIPTMGVNGKEIIYNADFVNRLALEELVFVLAHEVMHCVFAHMFRRAERDPKRWNVAGDLIINEILVDDGVGKMPADGLLDRAITKRANYVTDEVYNLLPEFPEGRGGPGEPGGSLDDCGDSPGSSQAEQGEGEAQMKVLVAQAAQAARMAGKLSAGLERLVDAAMKPTVRWEDVLRRFISARAKTEYTYARPKRRWINEDIFLPSLGGEKMGEILIAVDCSGSIGDQELAEFGAEMTAIKEDCRPHKMHVVYFDSEISHYDEFAEDQELTIAHHGGGGTAFSPIFRYAEEHDLEPVCCVVLTDLYCSDFGPPPAYPVLWVTNASTEAPWGEVVEMYPERRK